MRKLVLQLSKVNTLIHSLSSFGLSIVYTVGHIVIAWACATVIFQADFLLASADAIIEPVINGFWFFLLHKYAHKILRPASLAVVYTIGHFLIATSWSFMIIGVALSLAAVDAIVEPILNGFWFYALLYSWNSQPRLAT
ncbi:hypothetical protein OA404_01355 [SAR86 cluster bacterium]|nr:hypothetical protein [SAR86 cluster bacterium]